MPYTQTIYCHGAPLFSEVGGQGSGNYMSGQQAAKQVSNQVNPDTKVIDYRSCYGANGGPISNAQMLSNETGKTVIGYQGTYSGVSSHPVTFHPQSSATACVTGALNNAFGSIGAVAKKL
ncbi:hypothetical protein KZJ38_03520 [Paraburkholderia edwinii]|jgi:hypothetical protein|uniref:Uncharacterized protein n=1 Tax=Paraburkholderia edwinii TaxID=2861782 RepID=A0ABX8UKA5_9BURK|nr:hypothetical protein [Paraburkholderia edwinii]QYD69452.1 hypothetical protein KZJ38_03520 [Paraburkholderia edwinii]